MAKWNSEQIMADLGIILPVIAVKNNGIGHRAVTDNIELALGGVEDILYIAGFTPDFLDVENPSDRDVTHIVVTDGIINGISLTSTDYRLARAYIDVRQYFINRGFIVVQGIGDYF
jgi:hypothetical protein